MLSRANKLILFFICIFTASAHCLTMSPWVPIFKGVEHAVGNSDGVPRPEIVQAIRIDLYDPNIQFVSTPSNGAASRDTNTQTGLQFMISEQVQIGVNSSYFSPVGEATADITGLAMSEGQIVSPAENLSFGGRTLLITADNTANFLVTSTSTNLTGYRTAVESWPYFLNSGSNSGDNRTDPPSTFLRPRTAIGLDSNKRYMIIITVDGDAVNAGYSEGCNPWEAAQWLKRFGAWYGLNLDGGGSTHLWISEYGGNTYALNRPSSNRAVGNHLGVYAEPLSPIIYSDSHVYASFENDNESTFNQSLTLSGTTTGIDVSSSAAAVNTQNYQGSWSQQLSIIDSPSQSGGWLVRHLSGVGERASNIIRPTNGFVGFWAKTNTAGCEIAITLDDTYNVTADRGIFKSMIADGQWHLYEWNLENAVDWQAWANGDGIINSRDFTIDSFQIRNNADTNAAIYFDEIAHSSRMSLTYLFATKGDFEPDGDVDFSDFALLAQRWMLTSEDTGFERYYDISDPGDDLINMQDFLIFAENWLNGTE